jgi:hypothetical protein
LFSTRNFASATAALAALRSVNIRPKQLSEFWELIESTGNHQSYRLKYLTGPGLPCPTPHVRELEHTQYPREVLAEILRFKSYIASRDERPNTRIKIATDQVIPQKFETSNILCLVCRQRLSKYSGLRLKCILIHFESWKLPKLTYRVGAECYRRGRTCGRPTVAEAKVRKHAYEAVDEKNHPAKRIRAIPANSQDVISSKSQMVDGIALAAHSSSSFVKAYGLRLDLTLLSQFSIPPTPPRTPQQQRAFSLPHLGEFEEGVSRLGPGWQFEYPPPLGPGWSFEHPPPLDPSQGFEWTPPLLPLANMEAYGGPLTRESVENGGNLGRPSLPPPRARVLATSNPSLGAMFAEAARAAGRRFYPAAEGEAVATVVASGTKLAAAAPSEEPQNNLPPKPQAVRAAGRWLNPAAEGEAITTIVPSGTHPAVAAPSEERQNDWQPKPQVARSDRHDPGRNKAGLWHVFPPPAPQLTTTMANTTVYTLNTAVAGHASSAQQFGEEQAVKGTSPSSLKDDKGMEESSSSSRKADKGKGKPIEGPSKILG